MQFRKPGNLYEAVSIGLGFLMPPRSSGWSGRWLHLVSKLEPFSGSESRRSANGDVEWIVNRHEPDATLAAGERLANKGSCYVP